MFFLCIITFTSLIMFAVCHGCYASACSLKNGRLLGTKLPMRAGEHPDIKKLQLSYKRNLRFTVLSSLILHIPVFFLCFWYTSVFLLYYIFWCVWLFYRYIHGWNRAFRELYRLKQLHGWFFDEASLDGDPYWLTGSYKNPDDPRLLAPSRNSSGSLSFNLGRPAGRRITRGISLFCVVLLLGIEILFLYLDFTPFVMTLDGGEVQITAPMYPFGFSLSEIEEVSLLNELPKGTFHKNSGADTNQFLLGKFRLDTLGQCQMYYYFGCEPILRIDLADITVFYNSKNEGEVRELYELLTEALAP